MRRILWLGIGGVNNRCLQITTKYINHRRPEITVNSSTYMFVLSSRVNHGGCGYSLDNPRYVISALGTEILTALVLLLEE